MMPGLNSSIRVHHEPQFSDSELASGEAERREPSPVLPRRPSKDRKNRCTSAGTDTYMLSAGHGPAWAHHIRPSFFGTRVQLPPCAQGAGAHRGGGPRWVTP